MAPHVFLVLTAQLQKLAVLLSQIYIFPTQSHSTSCHTSVRVPLLSHSDTLIFLARTPLSAGGVVLWCHRGRS